MSTAPARTGFVPVARVEDVPPGWVLRVAVGTRLLAIANCDGVVTALDHACSHAGGPLGDNRLRAGCFIECPWHNSVFDARTGEVHRGPARAPQPVHEVHVEDGTIFVGLETVESLPNAVD